MIDLNALADESTYADGDQTYVRLVDAVAKAIDPDAFARIEPDPLVEDEDREWLYAKADAVIDALNALGFLAVPQKVA